MTQKPKIMIVEDEFITAKGLSMELSSLGYGVCDVASSDGILDAIESEKPDLVLMDINIQGEIGGIEAAGRIKARFGIPIVFLTGYPDEETREQADTVGHDGYLIKPVESYELCAAFDKALQNY